MARKPTRQEQLVNEALKRERDATRKMNRIRNRTGAKVANTEFDPRAKDANLLRGMNGRELRSHINKLNKFIDRSNQFESGFNGAPIPRRMVEQYRSLEERNNAKAAARENALRDIKLPGSDTTIGMRIGMFGDRSQGVGDMNRQFQQIHRPIQFVKDANSLQKLIDQMKGKTRLDYLEKGLNPRLNSLFALLEGSGNQDLIEEVKGMSLEQKNILIDYSNFSEIARDRFSSGDDTNVTREDEAYYERTGHSRELDIREQLERVLDWAKGIKVSRGRGTVEYTDTTAQAISTQFDPRNTNAGPITLPQSGKRGKRK